MRLVIIHEPGSEPGQFQPKIFDLSYDPLRPVRRIGRHSSNDIVISDASVSRHHTEIEVRSNGLLVRDLGSSNGTFVNNQRLEPNLLTFVRPGEQLVIGNVQAIIEPDVTLAISEEAHYRNSANYAPSSPPPIVAPPPDFRQPQPPSNVNYAPSPSPYPSQEVSYSYPPSVAPLRSAPLPGKAKPVSGPNWFIIGALLGGLILGLGILSFALFQVLNNNSSATPATVTLPSNIFASPANSEAGLGINLARPSAWKKTETANGAQLVFTNPQSPTTIITLEKPPGPIIGDASLSPEVALRQYLANVQLNSQNFRSLAEPSPTRLKDGTPGYFARLGFSTTREPIVTNYTVNVLTFRCNNALYFASAGANGADYNGATQQDLEAAIANFKC